MSVIVKNISRPIYEACVRFQIRVWDSAIFEKVRYGRGKEWQLKIFFKKIIYIFYIFLLLKYS